MKVDLQSTPLTEVYNSLNGKSYTVTAENKEEIRVLQQADLKTIQGKAGDSVLKLAANGVTDGGFSGWHALMYSGKTAAGNEYLYDYVTYYDNQAFIEAGDTVATAWTTHAVRVSAYAKFYSILYGTVNGTVNVGSPYGTSTVYNSLYGHKGGYMSNSVRIPVTYAGYTANFSTGFSTGYAHPYTPLQPSVAIGPASITFTAFLGSQWSWSNSFTIGNSAMH